MYSAIEDAFPATIVPSSPTSRSDWSQCRMGPSSGKDRNGGSRSMQIPMKRPADVFGSLSSGRVWASGQLDLSFSASSDRNLCGLTHPILQRTSRSRLLCR
jgi:hypothetical protein